MIARLDLYRFFIETARSGSISGAAKKLFVSQPAVSAAIMQLEETLGVILFNRASRGVTLTYEGELLYEYVKSAFSYIKAGEDKLRDIRCLEGGFLRVGASDMTLRFYLLDYIARFNVAYPQVRLTVTNAPTPKTLAAIRAGEIDFGVVSGPVEESSDIELTPVRQIQDIIVASSRYTIGSGGEAVPLEALASYPKIMLEGETSTREWLNAMLPAHMRTPDIELATSDLILEFARRGLGIAFIVADFAYEDLERGTLHEIRLTEPFPMRSFLLARSRRLPLSAAARTFMNFLETTDSGTNGSAL